MLFFSSSRNWEQKKDTAESRRDVIEKLVSGAVYQDIDAKIPTEHILM